MEEKYNVHYEWNGITKEYLAMDCDYETAQEAARKCRQLYVGKQYPNKKGFYPVTNVRVVRKL